MRKCVIRGARNIHSFAAMHLLPTSCEFDARLHDACASLQHRQQQVAVVSAAVAAATAATADVRKKKGNLNRSILPAN